MKNLLFLLLFLCTSLHAQNKQADSLLSQLSKASTDSGKVVLYNALSKQYLLSNPKEAMRYGKAAEELSAIIGYSSGSVKAFILLGSAHLIMGEYDDAMDCNYRALRLGRQQKDTISQIASYINLGNVYHKIKDPDRALHHYFAAIRLAKRINDQAGISKVYNNLGNVYEDKGSYSRALSYYRRAANVQEELKDKRSLAISLHNIGNVHLLLEEPEKGLPYLFKSISLNEKLGNDIIKMASLGRVAEIYSALGKNEEALAYARQSIDMAMKVGSSKKIAEAALLMQGIYASMKEHKQAYDYLMLSREHEAIINAERRTRIESELTAKYETEQKELENQFLKEESDRLAHEIHQQKVTLILEGCIIFLMLVLLVVLYISRKRGKAAFARLQEAHLLMQEQQREILSQKNELALQAAVQKEQNEQLGKHNMFKNKVLSIMTHDLRAPFNSTKGILELAQCKPLSESEIKHIFGLLGKQVNVVLNMLDNVLVWSKAQFEETEIMITPVNLHLLAEDNVKLTRAQAEQKNITLLNCIEPGAVAFADKERLNFVVRNLLMNAVKFTYPGGEIILSATEQEEETVLIVEDNGKGISAADIRKLFAEGRFTTPGTSGEKGTGLGLKLCKELAESFRGSLHVSSEEGKGSTFSIALPKVNVNSLVGEVVHV